MSTAINIGVIVKDQATRELRGIGRMLSGFGKTAATALAGVGVAATATVVAVGRMMTGAANYADTIDKMSIRTGIATDKLQELGFITGQSGTNLQTFESGIQALARRLGEAGDANSGLAKALRELGVSVIDTQGRTRAMGDLFSDIRLKLSQVTDTTHRAQLANEIFSRSGADLLPVLSLSQAEFDGLARRAHDLGLVMTAETIRAFVEAGDKVHELKEEFAAVSRQIATDLLPFVQNELIPFVRSVLIPAFRDAAGSVAELMKAFVALPPEVQKFIVAGTAVTAVLSAAGFAAAGLANVWKVALVPLAMALKPLILALATALGVSFGAAVGIAVAAIAGLVTAGVLLYQNWEKIKEMAVLVWTGINTVTKRMIDGMVDMFLRLVDGAYTWGRDLMEGFLNGITGMMGSIWSKVKEFAKGVTDTIKDTLQIRSPSRVMMTLGRMTGEGFAVGMEKAMSNVAMPAVVPSMGGGRSLTFSPSINVNGGTNMGAQDFEKMLSRYWQRATRSAGL